MDLSAVIDALAAPFLDPASRTWLGGLAFTAVVAVVLGRWSWSGVWAGLRHPSTGLDVQLLVARQLSRALVGVATLPLSWWLATKGVIWLDRVVGRPEVDLPGAAVVALYSACLFVAWDLSRFLLHLALHRLPVLWSFHQVHHSAEVLSPLTFHRIHPVESWLYQLRGVAVTTPMVVLFFWLFRAQATQLSLLGVPALGLVLNVLMGNLRHSQVWLPFPEAVERWLISPAQHQLHHSVEAAHHDANYGTWIALWDRLAGTWQHAERPPRAFGLAERNHGDDLLSAWLGPVREALGQLRPRRAVVAALGLMVLSPLGHAEEEEEDEESTVGMEILVTDEDGTVRVAGSAHVVDAAALEQFEYDDIERVLSQVPGITTRGEDGYGLRPNIGIRGANSDRSAKITLMEDGVLLAPAPYAAPAAYYFPMTTRMVAVEIFKGPAATRFGPQTVAGAMNLRTRAVPRDLDYGLDLAGGLRMTGKAHAYVGDGKGGSGWLVEGVHLGTQGFKELDGGGPTGFNHSEFMAKGKVRAAPGHHLELKLGYARELSHETYLGLSIDDYAAAPYRRYAASSQGLMTWDRTQAELAWGARLSDSVKVRTVAYHHWLSRQWTKFNGFEGGPDLHSLMQVSDPTGQGAVYMAILRGEEDTTSSDQVVLIGTNDRRFHSFGVQSTARWELHGDKVGSELEAGLRLHVDDVVRIHTEDPFDMLNGALVDNGSPTETILDSQATAQALAAHLHEDLRLGRLHLLPGVRLEVVRTERVDVGEEALEPQTRATPLPGLGALYGINQWLDVFAGSYRGFSPVAPGQPEEVLPETSWNHEAGFRFDQGDRHLEVVGFINDYVNLTGQCTLSGGCEGELLDQQFNGGRVWVQGLEATAGYELLVAGLVAPVSASYSLTDGTFTTGFVSGFPQFGDVEPGDALPYVPRHQAAGRAGLRAERWELGMGASWRSGMLDAAGTFPVTEADLPELFLLDAAARWQASRAVSIYATGTNLTGSTAITSWRPIGARPTAPLQVMVGLKVERPPKPPPPFMPTVEEG